MTAGADVREAGDSAFLLRLPAVMEPAVNARAIAIAQALRERGLAGVRDVVPAIHTVAVYVDPQRADAEQVVEALREAAGARLPVRAGATHDVRVVYGGEHGPDLPDVARFAGIIEADVVAVHASTPYRVFMRGFQPGFAYLGLVDPRIAMPRRQTPRVKVPAGAVGIAGQQTGIYPRESPGGWQIIGRALDVPEMEPGDAVRFVAVEGGAGLVRPANAELTRSAPPSTRCRTVAVIRPGLFTTIQTAGEWGRQARGFPVSGPMDPLSHAIANLAVGNERAAAALEVTITGPELRFEQEITIAIAGADLSPAIDDVPVAMQTPVACAEGSILRFGERRAGARAYVAFDGGIACEPRWPVTPIAFRDTLTLHPPTGGAGRRLGASENLPFGGARLRVMRGPQDDQLPPAALDALLSTRFLVSPQSNRMGYRLKGRAASWPEAAHMMSDATFPGAIQMPPTGEPILLMVDRQTTGGYPQIATVITADLGRAGQLVPGDWVEFELCSRAEALSALAEQEAMLAGR